MAAGDYRLWKQESNGTWSECTITAQSDKILGFNTSLNPVMVTNASTNFDFYSTVSSVLTSGTVTVYNEAQRFYYFKRTNYSASTITISISKNESGTGTFPAVNVEHYVLLSNESSATKTILITGAETGSKIIMADASGISVEAGKFLEIGYVWMQRNTDYVCIITRSNILTQTTV